jgi:hypothetical protein
LLTAFLAGLLAISGLALAEHEDDHPEDTLFSFGYDAENHILAINLGANDTLYLCDYGDDELTATYSTVNDDGSVEVTDLEDADGVKTFEPRLQHELADGLVEAETPVEYTGGDGECALTGAVVAGPNGQINHGQFMKAAKSLLDINGHGCVVRYLAKSDIGRTDETKIRTPDVDDSFEPRDTGDITLESFEADCNRGKNGKNGKNEDNGRPASPGKSGNAPGKNK